MHSQRLEVLTDNEKHVANGGKDDWGSSSDDDADVGNENINELNGENNDDFEDEDSDAEWEKQQQLLGKLGPNKVGGGGNFAGDAMKDFGLDGDEDSDDEDDEDYEYNGGDGSLYDSRIDNVDELKTLRDTLAEISQGDPALYSRIMSGIADEAQLNKFQGLMGEVDGLCEREASVRRKIEELEKTKSWIEYKLIRCHMKFIEPMK